MKLGTTSHPKFRKLMMKMDLKQYEAAGLLELLWSMAAQFTDDGDLSRFDADDIAAYLDWRGDPQKLVDTLVECRWLDRDGDSVKIHDWADHMPHFITERVRKREQRAGQRPSKSQSVPGLSRDSTRTDSESCTESDLAQPSPAQASAAQPSQTNKIAAACAAAESENSFMKSVDLESATIAAVKLANAIRIDPANGLSRDYVWQSCVIASGIDQGIIPEIVTRLKRNEINRLKPYIDKTLRDECAKRSLDVAKLRGLCPPTPPPSPPQPIAQTVQSPPERQRPKPVNSIRVVDPVAVSVAS